MSEKRFIIFPNNVVWDNQLDEVVCRCILEGIGDAENVCQQLNEQEATIITLKRRLEKINGGYGLLTHRNGLTANECLIESQERELEKKNEQISDWIKQHSNDIAKIGEQQATINKQNELIELIANACTYSKEHSVKEILRKEIKGIDTVTYESANAWHDYVLLSEFFEECYGEHWDND